MPTRSMRHRYLHRSLLLLAAALVMLLGMLALFMYESHRIIAADNQQQRINDLLPPLREAVVSMLDAETGQRGYLLTGNPEFLQPYRRATADIESELNAAYRAMLRYDAARAVELERVAEIRRAKFAELQQTLDLHGAGQHEAALAVVRYGEGMQLMNEARRLLAPIINELRDQRVLISSQTRSSLRRAEWLMVGASLLLVAGVGLAIWLLLRILRENQELTQRLERAATHDMLTELPNRRLLDELLPTLLEQARRRSSVIGVIYVDLDGFKQINDELGHAAGDEVLKLMAERATAVLRRSDLLARVGGDEFAVVVIDSEQRERLAVLTQRLLDVLSAPLSGRFQPYGVGASIGVATFPEHGQTMEQLMHAADLAMYEAKRAGKGRVCFAGKGAAATAPV